MRRLEAPEVARPLAAVHAQHHGQRLAGLGVARARQITDEVEAVARPHHDRLERDQRHLVERRTGGKQQAPFLRRAVVMIKTARAGVALEIRERLLPVV